LLRVMEGLQMYAVQRRISQILVLEDLRYAYQ